jgi:predicted DNA-binding antitoxin AbrB/MazE fold protein
MSATPIVFPGIVRGGVVVFDQPIKLPEGTKVEITVPILEFTPEEAAEFAQWQGLRDEGWAKIDEWEKEDDRATG